MSSEIKKSSERTIIGGIGAAIGKGLIAGLAGTLAMSLSQQLERKITQKKADVDPAKAVERIFDIGPEPGSENKLSRNVHYAYGTLWGSARGVLSACGVNGFAATAVHFAAVWGTALKLESDLQLKRGPMHRSVEDLGFSALHHAVYSIVAGLVYDAID